MCDYKTTQLWEPGTSSVADGPDHNTGINTVYGTLQQKNLGGKIDKGEAAKLKAAKYAVIGLISMHDCVSVFLITVTSVM